MAKHEANMLLLQNYVQDLKICRISENLLYKDKCLYGRYAV